MKTTFRSFLVALMMLAAFVPSHSWAVTVGQIDNFEDGTTQGWFAGLGILGTHPAAPVNALGGPAGPTDNYLRLAALGGSGAGARLAAMNNSQWTGNYLAAGVGSISMDLINLGSADLSLRLVFEDPAFGPPTNIAFTQTAIFLPAGSGWTHAVSPIGISNLQAGLGNITAAMTNTTTIRLYHSPAPNFPNPLFPIPAIIAQLGVDNIQAGGTRVPEGGSTLGLLLIALSTVGFVSRRLRLVRTR